MFILTRICDLCIGSSQLSKTFLSRACMYQICILNHCLQIYSEVFKIISFFSISYDMKILKELEDSDLVYFSLKIVHNNFSQKSH